MLQVRVKRTLHRATCAVAALFALEPLSALAAPPARIVTLITGDRVTVDAAGNTVVHPAQGRKSVSIQVLKVKGHTHVIPSDARAALHAGLLDPRLFDVTELIASGYYNRATTPVIVTGSAQASKGSTSSLVASAQPVSASGRSLPVVEGVALAAPSDGSFWQSWTAARASNASSASLVASGSANKLWLDGRRKLSVEDNLTQIGADVAHERGLLGEGVTVAVIDSGIDATHRDLEGQVTTQKNFISDEEDNLDHVGHGTHVASIIAGTGAQSGGRFQGIAPKAKLIDAKACGESGCKESALLEAMQWAAEQGARVINMSLGANDSSGADLVEQALNKLSKEHGALFVVAAGNDFEFGLTVGSPASAESALAVGALDASELPSAFSQRGLLGQLSIKPELVAPGVNITGALSQFIAPNQGLLQEREDAPGYATASGTSAAAPHVSGAAALLSERHPDWPGDRLKAALMGSAKLLEQETPLEQGAGLVNIPGALDLLLRAEPAAVSFGTPAWPHDDDAVSEQAVTLYNDADSEVTLDLTLEASGPNGASAEGVFSLSDKKLTIDAHGKATVTLSANTREGTDGLSYGALIASNDKVNLHVPFAVQREVESYDLELRFITRAGEPADGRRTFASVLTDSDGGSDITYVEIQDDGTAKLRLPRSQYLISATITEQTVEPDSEAATETLLIYPRLDLKGDTQLTFDAGQGKPLKLEAPVPEAELAYLSLSFDAAYYGTSVSGGAKGQVFSASVGPAAQSATVQLSSRVDATWLPPGTPSDSAYQFNYSKRFPGELISGFEAHTELADYTRVDTKFARGGQAIPAEFVVMSVPADPSASFSSSGTGLDIALPSERSIYYIDDPAIAWQQTLSQSDFEAEIFEGYEEGRITFDSDERHQQQWNQAVFGPVAARGGFGANIQTRGGDRLSINPSLLGDSEGRSSPFNTYERGHARLFREGSLLAEFESTDASAEVPPEPASYRVEVELKRPEPAELSTEIKLAWEFASEHNDDSLALPLSYIRFQPQLNQNSAAPDDTTFQLPIRIEPQEQSDAPDAASLTVDVSYDDGETWAEAAVSGQGKDWTAQLEHPQQSGYVSLRAAAIDGDDNVVETTIIRAYRLE